VNDRQTDSYVAGVESVSGVPLAQTRPNSLLLSLGLTGLTTLSLARTPDGHGTRDVGPSPQSKKAETLPAAGLESGHESHLCSRVVEMAHHGLPVWGRKMLVKVNRVH